MDEVLSGRSGWPFWVHLDIDVLDRAVMPALDSPGSPGIGLPDLEALLGALASRDAFAGMTVTIYDPDLDPAGTCADLIAALLAGVFCGRTGGGHGGRAGGLVHPAPSGSPSEPNGPAGVSNEWMVPSCGI